MGKSDKSIVGQSGMSLARWFLPKRRKKPVESNLRRWTIPGTEMGFRESLILIAAVVVFLIGVLVSQAAKAPDPYPILLRSCVLNPIDTKRCAETIDSIHEGTHTYPYYDFEEALAEGLKALAVALAVTVGVVSVLETRNRNKINEQLAEKAQLIGINVFDALFGNNHSLSLLEKLKLDILYKPMIRESLNVRYVLTNFKGSGRLKGKVFTVVTATVTCTFKNIATVSGNIAHMPLEVSLPNPLLNELKKKTTLVRATVKRDNRPDVTLTAAEIAHANVTLQSGLVDDSAPEGVVPFGELILVAGESGGFEVEYTMVKESEDSELLRCFHTTNAISLTVIDNTGRNLHVRAKAIHSSALASLGITGNVSQWELREIILPQQGVMIWWKEHPMPALRAKRLPLAKPEIQS